MARGEQCQRCRQEQLGQPPSLPLLHYSHPMDSAKNLATHCATPCCARADHPAFRRCRRVSGLEWTDVQCVRKEEETKKKPKRKGKREIFREQCVIMCLCCIYTSGCCWQLWLRLSLTALFLDGKVASLSHLGKVFAKLCLKGLLCSSHTRRDADRRR